MTQDAWSAAESDVLASARSLRESGRAGVLVTVARVEGSAYRRPGAKMLVSADGDDVGGVTAGCLDGAVRRLADAALADGRPRTETFDLTGDGDDDVWGLGLGCNGVIDLLVEPVAVRPRGAFDAYEAGECAATLTVTRSTAPDVERWTRALYRPASGFASVPGAPALPERLAAELSAPTEALAARGESDTLRLDDPSGEVDVFVDGLAPPPTCVVLGTGPDVRPLVELASRNGFRVTVVGFRGGVDLESRFPDADARVSTSPADVADRLAPNADTYAVVATHNFVDDRIAVGELVRTPVEYVGVMGPRKRFDAMLVAFEDEGRPLSEAERDKVYAPVGLDLGGETPAQIATSVVSEVLAVANDRSPGHLSGRSEPIHERTESSVPR